MKNLLEPFVLIFLVSSCAGNLLEPLSENVDSSAEPSHEMIVLGKQLDDPYSVANMTKAMESLYPTKAGRVTVEPTDYYVRFLPKDEDEYERLELMGIHMLDHPVDYEIVREGDWYHDPSLEEEQMTWQYAVVDKDFTFPSGIVYEKLEECYIVHDDEQTKADGIDWAAVEREAFRITGNESLLRAGTKAGTGEVSGRITIEDPEFGTDPSGVKGVKVSCNVFVKFAHAYTDEDGYYSMKASFASNPRYRLVFKNKKGFGIGFNFILVPASTSTLGKGNPEGIDVHIRNTSDRKLFTRSVVNNAGYDYFSECEASCKSALPPSNLRIWIFNAMSTSSCIMMQQGALIDNSILSRYLGDYLFLVKMFLPDVTLGLKGQGDYSSIYATAIHEFAHASHFKQVGVSYWDRYIKFILTSFISSGFVTYGVGTEAGHGYCEVGEMWAYYMQTKVYQDRYDSQKVFGTAYWFSPQIFLNLDERGLTRFKIFGALTSDVTDRDILQSKLVSLYPECKSTINQAFGRYN